MSDLLTVNEAAAIFRVDDTTIRRWIKLGVLDAIILPHIGNRMCYRIPREALHRALNNTSSVRKEA